MFLKEITLQVNFSYERKLTENYRITPPTHKFSTLNLSLPIFSQSHERIFSGMTYAIKKLLARVRRKYHIERDWYTFCEALYRTLLSSIGNNFSSGFSNIFPQTHPVTECSCNSKSLFSALITRMVIHSVSQVYTKLLTGLNFWIESFKRKLKCMWNWCLYT